MPWVNGVWEYPKGFSRCEFVNVGMSVWAPCGDGRAIRCVVTTAAGTQARVENGKCEFSGWFDVHDLAVGERAE